jgi:hypothetical protein
MLIMVELVNSVVAEDVERAADGEVSIELVCVDEIEVLG